MNKTLYLLRRTIDQVNPAVFLPSETVGDVILLETETSSVFSHSRGTVYSVASNSTHTHVSYEAVIEKIFDSDRVIVL